MENRYLSKTRMLDYDNESIRNLVNERGWNDLDEYRKIGAILKKRSERYDICGY